MRDVLIELGDRPSLRARRTRIAMLVALSAIVAGAMAIAPAGRASAADFGEAPVSDVSLTPTAIGDSGTARLDFTWAAPPGAAPGDTFAITLPAELEPVSTREVQLVDADTAEVAVRGVWSGKTVTFTFAAYLATHTQVHGTGFFSVKWDHTVVDRGAGTFDDLVIAGQLLPTITKGGAAAPVQQRGSAKAGGWSDSTQSRFTWALAFPGSTAGDIAGPVTLSDNPPADAGYSFDCAAAQMRVDIGGYPTSNPTYPAPGSTPNTTSYICTATSISMTLSSIPAGSFYTLLVPVVITDPDRNSFDNTATFNWATLNGVPQVQPANVRRDDAGGTVLADASVCVGDYVWIDANDNGVQDEGESGIPGVVLALQKLDAQGGSAPVLVEGVPMTATTDAGGKYLFCGLPVLLPGEKYRVTVPSGQAALAAYAATISGAGTFSTDSSAAEAVADSVEDLTVGGASDLSLDFGYVLVVTPTPASPDELAQSGATPATGGTAIAGMLVLVYGLTLHMRARRRA